MNNNIGVKSVRLAWIAATLGVFYSGAGLAFFLASGAHSFVPAVLASAALFLLALLTAGKFHFARREADEKENLEAFRLEHPGTELFDESDEALKLAHRANRLYCRFVIPAGGVIVGAAVVGASLIFWRAWDVRLLAMTVEDPLQYAVLSLSLFVLAMIGGAYYVGASREAGQRWLRPQGAWLFFAGFLYLLAGVSLLLQLWQLRIPNIQLNTARIELIFLMILGAELFLSVIIDFYRPRTTAEERPVFESRMLALFTEPGGVAQNIAAALDYQFGFELSEARFYRFFERTLIPFAGLMFVLFWMMTCIIVIGPEENAIHERFGKVLSTEPLEEGLHLKLPWPFDKVYRFPVERVQEIAIGFIPGEYDDHELGGGVILWDQRHNVEETTYLVPNPHVDEMRDHVRLEDVGKVPVTTSFMSASIPLYFKVRDLYSYKYLHNDADSLIEKIAMREVVSYLAGVDIFDILTRKRGEGGRILGQRIQAAVDEVGLGIDIAFVGLEGLHPPVEVGDAFHKIVAAAERKETMLLESEIYTIQRKPQSEAEADKIRTEAETYRYEKRNLAEAEIHRFEKQLKAFSEQPELFVIRNFLDVIEEKTKGIRKFIVASGDRKEIVILDLTEKLRPDLLDIDLDAGDVN